MRLQVDF